MSIRISMVVLCLCGLALGQEGSQDARQSQGDRGDVLARTGHVSTIATGRIDIRSADQREFRLLATNKTSTMQKEMNEAADAGFHFEGTMGGETSFGGSEVVVIMSRDPAAARKRYEYKLLPPARLPRCRRSFSKRATPGSSSKGNRCTRQRSAARKSSSSSSATRKPNRCSGNTSCLRRRRLRRCRRN